MASPDSSKPRVVKDYDKLDPAVLEQIKLEYPRGFQRHLVSFKNAKGDTVSALPFETDDRHYLVRMTVKEARAIIADDDDYDADGNLTAKAQRAYAAKHDGDFDDGEGDLDLGEPEDLGLADDDEYDDEEDDDPGAVSADDNLAATMLHDLEDPSERADDNY